MFAFFPLGVLLELEYIEIQGLPSSDCNFKDFQGACEPWNGEAFILLGSLTAGIANFIDEWSHCDFRFTNFGVILENLEPSITTKKAIFRLYSTWSWHE